MLLDRWDHRDFNLVPAPLQTCAGDLLSARLVQPEAAAALASSTGHPWLGLPAVSCLDSRARVVGYHVGSSSAVSRDIG